MNELVTKTATSLTKKFYKTKFWVNKKSPEILFVGGLITFAGTVILACNATLKAEEVIERHDQRMRDIEDAMCLSKEEPEAYEYNEELYRRDKTIAYAKSAVEFCKLYAPSVALAALSITCFTTSRNIMQKRYLGVVAAYNAVSEAFKTYRKRVVDEVGEQMDRHYRYGTEIQEIPVKITDENGKTKTVKEKVENVDSSSKLPDDTSRFFDESNPEWDKNVNYNLSFLSAQQNIANDILHTRGHIFLNEVYDMLGFDHTSEGAVVGWIEGAGDNCVVFGIYDPENEGARRFVNGKSNAILLEFNHDGVIWDKIGK